MRRLLCLLSLTVLTLIGSSGLGATERYIAAAAHTSGLNGTFFQTDLRIANLTASPSTINITWLPSNTDNSSPQVSSVTIAARSSREIDDVVRTLFALTEGSGALMLSSSADFAATSRTYTTSSNGCIGTFGQFIPASVSSEALQKAIILNVRLSASPTTGFRSNVGVVNTTTQTATVSLVLRDANGTSLGTATLQLLPRGHTQQSVSTLFNQTTLTSDNLYIELSSNQPVFGYASVLDNQSGDPIFVPATADSGAPLGGAQTITARQWVFEPATIEVERGKPVTLTFRALDVEHGISLSGVGAVTCSNEQAGQCVLRPNENVTVTFTPGATGSFAFFCTRFCGESGDATAGHATMRGTIVVK